MSPDLGQALKKAAPRPGLPLDIREVARRAQTATRRSRAFAVAGVAMLFVVGAAVAGPISDFLTEVESRGSVGSGDTPPSVETSTSPPLTGDPTITAEIRVPEGLNAGGGLAAGADAVWVALDEGVTDDGGGGFIGRIDPATNEIVAQIPVEGTPLRNQIAATDEAVWVGSGDGVERINPASNEIVARVEIADGHVAAVAADATGVWALAIVAPSDNVAQWTGSLVRIDPATNAIVADIPLGSHPVGYLDELRIGAGSVWVLGVRWIESNNDEYGSELIRVDSVTNEIVARIPVDGFHMVVGNDQVLVRFPADGVLDSPHDRWLWTRVDVSTNEPSPPFAFDEIDPGDGLRLVTPEALWAVGYDEAGDVRVMSFDPATLEMTARSGPIRPYFHDALVDTATRTVWIATGKVIVRLDVR